MPVPSSINDLSTSAGSNSPGGGETPGQGDDHLRAAYSFLALLRDKLNGTSATGTVKDATFSGTQAGAATWAELQTFAAGINVGGTTYTSFPTSSTYSPTFTAGTNVSSVSLTGSGFRWSRVGNIVKVGGAVSVTCTASSGTTDFGISLPVASNFASGTDCTGVLNPASITSIETVCGIFGDVANDRAKATFIASVSATARVFCVEFSYTVL